MTHIPLTSDLPSNDNLTTERESTGGAMPAPHESTPDERPSIDHSETWVGRWE